VDSHTTVLSQDETAGLGTLRLRHPPGTFAPSPATLATLRAVAQNADSLSGVGVDWGCGIGVLSIAAARIDGVEKVIGLELSRENVAAAAENASLNGVEDRVTFAASDSYQPLEAEGRALLETFRGRLDFIIANPPHSPTNDGFDFRRRVIREGAEFLKAGGLVLLQALSAYGPDRVGELAAGEYDYEGIALRTELVPLDFGRAQLQEQIAIYVGEEQRGGRPYEFYFGDEDGGPVTAVEALRELEAGETILGRWQVHRFTRLA